jgi:DNA-directed RNA polymerase specialized sigma24 family protein
MAQPGKGSVTRWIDDLRDGEDEAARQLWERYFDRLVRLARARLRTARGEEAVADGEDAALDAFDSLCRGAAQGRFPHLDDRDDLWRLLVVLTTRKAIDQRDRARAVKRGGRAIRAGDVGDLAEVAGREPSPELAAMLADEYRSLREGLGDESIRRVFDLRMEGHSREEIAARLGCAVRTVARKLDLIRTALGGEAAG